MSRRRVLTAGERELAAAWLPSPVVLDTVSLCCGRFLPGQPANVAITPFGVPYFPDAIYCDDFSTAALELRAIFIHELVHVWQHQRGVAVAWRGIWLHLRHWRGRLASGRGDGGPYAYRLAPGRALLTYNIEQQAQIVEDVFRLASGADARFPQAAFGLTDYMAVIGRSLTGRDTPA